jgi:hypothetical protein
MNIDDSRLMARFQRLTTELLAGKRLGQRSPELTDELYQSEKLINAASRKVRNRNVMSRADRHGLWLAGLVMLSSENAAPPLRAGEVSSR